MSESFLDNPNRDLDNLIALIKKTNKFLAEDVDPEVKKEYLNNIRSGISYLFPTQFVYQWDRQLLSDAEFIEILEKQVYSISKKLPYLVRRLISEENPYEYIQLILELCKPIGYLYFHCQQAKVRPTFARIKQGHLKTLKSVIDINLQYFQQKLPLYYHDIKKFLTNVDSDGDTWNNGLSSDLPPQSGPTGGKGIDLFGGDWVPVEKPFVIDRINIPSRVVEA